MIPAQALEKLLQREALSSAESEDLMNSIMSGRLKDTQIAGLLTALRVKGETAEEIAGFVRAMRDNSIRIRPGREGLIDTCGTGGDARGTFNISTAAALVAASMGIPVAKHGNRAVSSRCGSADVLEALDIDITLPPEAVSKLIDDVGIGFLFAPTHHPAMKHAASARKDLGVRTVFNLLGPLTNPAGVKRQIVGVFAPRLTELVCNVLFELGAEKAFAVHGLDGTDEVSITGETIVSSLENGEVNTFRFVPEDAGMERADVADISGGSPEENAGYIKNILSGRNGARSDAVILNAAFAALLADRVSNVADGVKLSREAVESGRTKRLLEELSDASRALGEKARAARAARDGEGGVE